MNNLMFIILMMFSSWVMAKSDTFTLVNKHITTMVTTSDLEVFPIHHIKTSTNFMPVSLYSGVLISDFIKKYDIPESSELKIYALDDYSYTVPVADLVKYHAILAYKKDGKNIEMSSLGPYLTVFPKDDLPELQSLDIDAKTVWMIKTIEVRK